LTKIIRNLAFTATLLVALPTIANATCGTQGGPGYRGPDGQCVSWARFSYVCGPDGSRCQPEKVNPLIKELQNGADPRKLMEKSRGLPSSR
jgi:hypothetical protein